MYSSSFEVNMASERNGIYVGEEGDINNEVLVLETEIQKYWVENLKTYFIKVTISTKVFSKIFVHPDHAHRE